MTHVEEYQDISHILGTQLAVELYDCRTSNFDDLEWIQKTLVDAALQARATIINVVFHKFNPIGISGVVVIAESHLAIHTWPEHKYAAVDVFTCGDLLDGNLAISHIAERFESLRYVVKKIDRGLSPVRR